MRSPSADLQPKFPMTAAVTLCIQTGRLREMCCVMCGRFGRIATWKSLRGNRAREEAERNMGCVNTPSAPRARGTITYGMSRISIYTGG